MSPRVEIMPCLSAHGQKLTTECPEPTKFPWYYLRMGFMHPISTPSQDENQYVLTVYDYILHQTCMDQGYAN